MIKKSLIATLLASVLVVSAQAKDIVDTAVDAGSFKTLATALGAAGLVETLKGKGPFIQYSLQQTRHSQRFPRLIWKRC